MFLNKKKKKHLKKYVQIKKKKMIIMFLYKDIQTNKFKNKIVSNKKKFKKKLGYLKKNLEYFKKKI